MNVLLVMIPLSLLLLAGAATAFFWAVDHDQFTDLETPALVPLDDSPEAAPCAEAASRNADAAPRQESAAS